MFEKSWDKALESNEEVMSELRLRELKSIGIPNQDEMVLGFREGSNLIKIKAVLDSEGKPKLEFVKGTAMTREENRAQVEAEEVPLRAIRIEEATKALDKVSSTIERNVSYLVREPGVIEKLLLENKLASVEESSIEGKEGCSENLKLTFEDGGTLHIMPFAGNSYPWNAITALHTPSKTDTRDYPQGGQVCYSSDMIA